MIIRGNTVSTTIAPEKIAEKIGGTGGSNTLIVKMDDDGLATYSSNRIEDHIRNGGTAIARYYLNVGDYMKITDYYFDKCYYDELENGDLMLYVSFVSTVEPVITTLTIDEKRTPTVSYTELATSKDIGDISTALDELHTYAQGLINGGASE
jgi:hypothetical protein